MQIRIAPKDGVPLYQQIVNQVKYLVASGRLTPGEELLPIRVLAEQLLINPNTVARAYRELETAGLLTKRLGAGTYVSGDGSPLAWSERMKILQERAAALVVEARQLGVPIAEVMNLVQESDRSLPSVADKPRQEGKGEGHE